MKKALERIYRAPGHEDFVHMNTAAALYDQGLVEASAPGTIYLTGGGTFPRHKVVLSTEGLAFCKRAFKTKSEETK